MLARTILSVLVLLATTTVFAQHKNGYCTPKYGTYSVPYDVHAKDAKYPVYSAWVWSPWATDGTYSIRQRWVYTDATTKTLEDDGWLYIKIDGTPNGYTRALLKVQYGVPQLGAAIHGYDVFKYYAAQVVGPVVAVQLPPTHIPAVELPTPANVQQILGDPDYNNDVASEDSYKAELLRVQGSQRIAEARLKLESDKLAARRELANRAQDSNELLQYAAALREFAATRRSQTAVGNVANGDAASITLANRNVANILATKCLQCHGPNRKDKNLDMRNADSFSQKMWAKISRLVHSGEMPQDPVPKLTPQELEEIDSMLRDD
jgi:mono/diheme cytochrome c family protein